MIPPRELEDDCGSQWQDVAATVLAVMAIRVILLFVAERSYLAFDNFRLS